MKNRCHTTLDEAAILSRIDNLAKKIKKRHRYNRFASSCF
jgi:hypothetical protein